jgi:hypothetical protein
LGQAERETIARDLAQSLEPKLSRVRIEATKPVEGMRITRNGEEVGNALLGDALPVDPGKLTIEVTAPGYERWTTELEVGKEAYLKTILIPEFKAEQKKETPAPSNGLRPAAFVIGGVGVAALGAGAIFGGLAVQDKGEADSLRTNKSCNAEGFAHIEDAKTKALISSVSLGVGAAALGAGVVLFFVSRPPAAKTSTGKAWILPTIGSQGGGAMVVGTF